MTQHIDMLHQLDLSPVRSHVNIPPAHHGAPLGLAQICRKPPRPRDGLGMIG